MTDTATQEVKPWSLADAADWASSEANGLSSPGATAMCISLALQEKGRLTPALSILKDACREASRQGWDAEPRDSGDTPKEPVKLTICPKILQFDGPKNCHCFGTPYIEMRSVADTRAQAIADFQTQLDAALDGAEQIAWRRRPRVECHRGRWLADARLAIY